MKIFDWTNNIKNEELDEVVNALNNDKIVVFPTETVYGIGGNALKVEVINKLFQAKKRNYGKPISLLVGSIDKIKNIAYVDKNEEKIIKAFMPGELTLVLKKKACVNDLVTAGKNTVGVRIPNHNIALCILNKVDFPLATSSANISGENNIADFDEIVSDLKDYVDIFIKGNISDDLKASTVVELNNDIVNILREGKISKIDIEKTLE
ncbi:MAG: L-threonylcarbamoyladenylate synthase [Bacilli bacterium]